MSRGGRTHAVRNGYGHIEYLTDDEIANLRERGEDIDVVDDYRGHPPIAKNSANQAYINEAWYNEQKKKEEKRQARGRRAGRIARGTVSAAFGLAGAVTNPGLAGDSLPGHEGDARGLGEGWKNAARVEQRDGQARTQRRATRDKGVSDRGTGQQD